MITPEEFIRQEYGLGNQDIDVIALKGSTIVNDMKEYVKQLLSDYTDRLSPQLSIKSITKKTTFEEKGSTFIIEKGDTLKASLHISVDKESITHQLELFKQEIGL